MWFISLFFLFFFTLKCVFLMLGDRIYTLSASDAFWLFENSTFSDTFVMFQAALSQHSGCLRCCFCLYCLSWVVRKHYPDSCFCCCFFLIESSSLKPVLRGHKNKYDFGPVAVAGMRAPPPIKVLSWTKECYSISCSPTQSHCLL